MKGVSQGAKHRSRGLVTNVTNMAHEQLVCGKIYVPRTYCDGNMKLKNWRSMSIRTYCPKEKLETFLRSVPCIAWSYCTHDKDVDDDGKPHMTHTHCIVHFDGFVRLTKLAKYLDSDNTRVEPILDRYKAFEYLIHANSPQKHQYDVSERVSLNPSYYIRLSQVAKEERRASDMEDLLSDVLSLPMFDFAKKYGRDGILHYTQYYEYAMLALHPEPSLVDIVKRIDFVRDINSVDFDYSAREIDLIDAKHKLVQGLSTLVSHIESWKRPDDAMSAYGLLKEIVQIFHSANHNFTDLTPWQAVNAFGGEEE